MGNIAVLYPGSFDPITNGHIDLVQRAHRLFSKIIVAVAENKDKPAAFSLEQRVSLVKTALLSYEKVKVCGFDNLLVDFAREKGIKVVLRGLRAVSDFEFEFQLASMNRNLDKELETLFLTPEEQYAFISSSLVKEIARLKGDVSSFVPHCVKIALEELRLARFP